MSASRTSKWTRRQLAALLGATPLLAQVPSTAPRESAPGVPAAQPAPANASPEAALNKAYADVREASQKLRMIDVPADIEPAFVFKP